jgi:hypothetical protein
MISFRTFVIAFSALVLLAFGIAIKEHHDGYTQGQAAQRVAVDKQSLTTAHTATTEATVNAEKFDKRVDEAHARTEAARVALAPIREQVAITPRGVTVNGDSTPSVVIPALVNLIQHQDTLQFRSDSELKAQQFRHVADTVMVGAAKNEAKAAVQYANDQQAITSPRCGKKCGIAIGVGSVALALVGLHQIGFHF